LTQKFIIHPFYHVHACVITLFSLSPLPIFKWAILSDPMQSLINLLLCESKCLHSCRCSKLVSCNDRKSPSSRYKWSWHNKIIHPFYHVHTCITTPSPLNPLAYFKWAICFLLILCSQWYSCCLLVKVVNVCTHVSFPSMFSAMFKVSSFQI